VVTSVPYHLSADPDEDGRVVRKRSGATLAESAEVGEPYATNTPTGSTSPSP
jgi:hypothetical protein